VGQKGLAALYSVLLLVTFGFGFNAVQSYVVATSLSDSFGVPTWSAGPPWFSSWVSCSSAASAHRRRGGDRGAGHGRGLLRLALLVIGLNIDRVPEVLATIVSSAFGFEPALGGGLGVAVMQGVKRGLFSNEAGLGSAPNVAAVATVAHPASQGIVQAFSVFIDTLVMCSCTALIILLSDVYTSSGPDVSGVALTQNALAEHLGAWGGSFVSVALVLFAFSSIMYNYYLGENSLNYFSEENQRLFIVYRVLVLGLVFWGAAQDLGTVFSFADLTMGLLGVVNLIGLIWMSRLALRSCAITTRSSRPGS
jgi:AGCS family alanine or glycine:cation symporter